MICHSKRWLAALLAIAMLLTGTPAGLQAAETFVTIGGGDYSGVYYPVGLAIASMLNQRRQTVGLRATVEATKGTIFNVNALTAGHLEFGLVQADDQYHAVSGSDAWQVKGPQMDLRAVFSLYREVVTLVAAEDAGIRTLADLKGKRVSLGSPSPSQRRIVIETLQTVGINPEEDLVAVTTTASEAPALLKDRVIDAFFFVVGHPSDSIYAALSSERRARIIPVDGPEIDRLVAGNSYYSMERVPVQTYYAQAGDKAGDVATFGVLATLCTSAKVPDRIVYDLTKVVFENLDEFKEKHPSLADLSREGMLKGFAAPLHPGARQYFQDAGLME